MPRSQLDELFDEFRNRFFKITSSENSDEEKRAQIADLIDLNDWCRRVCLMVCRGFSSSSAELLRDRVLETLCDRIRRGGNRILEWRGAKRYFRTAFRRAARRVQQKDGLWVTGVDAMLKGLPAPDPDSRSHFDVNSQDQILELLLNYLPQNDSVVVQRRMNLVSFKEIAETLNITPETARKRYQRAIEKMKYHRRRLGLDYP